MFLTKHKIKSYIANKKQGFTLIEVLVSVVIFSLLLGFIISVFVLGIRLQRYNLSYQQMLDQTSYGLEYMARALRMAQKDETGACTGTANSNYGNQNPSGNLSDVKFLNYKGQCQEFYLDQTTHQLAEKIDNNSPNYITSTKFNISYLEFLLLGENGADSYQPRVTISFNIEGKEANLKPKLQMQTTVSQRNIDGPGSMSP
jgi:prepilin-type N-terminal cleavage/methylation domain-containing protein